MQYLACLGIALSWSGAALIGRYLGLNPYVMTVFITGGTVAVVSPFLVTQDFTSITMKVGAIALFAGILNGIGLLCQYFIIAGSATGKWELGNTLPIGIVGLSLAIFVGSWYFFGDAMTTQRSLGIVLAVVAIWLLR